MTSDAMNDPSPHPLTRRTLLRGLGAGLALAPLGALPACGGADSTPGTGGAGGAGGGTGEAGAGGQAGTGGGGDWASGGTGSISDDYRDPFTDGRGAACALTCAMTLGPCYAQTIERKDISEGYPGLPVRLALRVVDEACAPIEGATIDIWHTRNTGLYSGDDAVDMCTGGDEDALSHRYFRGMQPTDAQGRVDFDTCYPGWYSGRAIHIHFTVRVGGEEYVTSQLFFPEELTAELFAGHPDYAALGQPDTTNASDSIYGGEEYLLSTEKQADGSLLAWKTLVIRSSLADELCSTGGMGGPPGGGMGPPPGG
ncbi:hypothetical protein WME95_18705 [Sorangium sp. So ce327]|uniref:dioxygenase family protein n=1 Tax=Sorangium sp. So ce327 TaxID=3133301 RepID=UPI003F644D19